MCHLYLCSREEGTVSLFSIHKKCLVSTIKYSTNPLHSLALNNEESMLAMGSHIWDKPSKIVTKTLERSC